jgi:DNA-binding CsgD family transcriptional regulator
MDMNKRRSKLAKSDWQAILEGSLHLSAEERAIIALLAQGKSQAQVGVQLGMHRSVVWRKARQIAERNASTNS